MRRAHTIIPPQPEVDSFVLAIDGPAGAGKSTVARALARQFGLAYLDSGAMYRCVALLTARLGVDPSSHGPITNIARSMTFELLQDGDGQRVLLNGEDVSTTIRGPEITELASVVSRIPGVRHAMVELQRRYRDARSVVAEGRDIGTVVFPDANLKIFLNAPLQERSRRRASEISASTGEAVNEATVRDAVATRDARDRERKMSPLVKADDAIEIETGGLSVDQVIDTIGELLSERMRATARDR